MQYREFGKLGFKVSAFGFGCMRLPLEELPDRTVDSKRIDEKEAISMIHYAVDHGVNYIDTAYPYHGGNSELLVAKALKGGYREKVKLATKLPVWFVNTYEDFEKYLDEQLAKLEVDYIDFYLLHALNRNTWPKIKKLNVLKFLDRAIESGKIKHAGFSFHDELPLFKEIIDSYNWDMCQIQLNFLDEYYQAGTEGMRYAASKGIPVVVMEPLRGGSLAKNIPQDVKDVWNAAPIKRTPVDWAFRWLYNFPEVTVILSGVSTMEQLKDNIDIFSTALPNSMTEEEVKLVHRVQELYKSKIKVNCTGCGYCTPCPAGVAIPDIFKLYNNSSIFDALDEHMQRYSDLIQSKKDASLCAECGNCESACPQNISVIEKLKEAHGILVKK